MIKKRGTRTIKTGRDYTAFRVGMWEHQSGQCRKCSKATMLDMPPFSDWSFHVHHKKGRGMGGGKRDDTMRACEGLCGSCHRGMHNQ